MFTKAGIVLTSSLGGKLRIWGLVYTLWVYSLYPDVIRRCSVVWSSFPWCSKDLSLLFCMPHKCSVPWIIFIFEPSSLYGEPLISKDGFLPFPLENHWYQRMGSCPSPSHDLDPSFSITKIICSKILTSFTSILVAHMMGPYRWLMNFCFLISLSP